MNKKGQRKQKAKEDSRRWLSWQLSAQRMGAAVPKEDGRGGREELGRAHSQHRAEGLTVR